MLFLRPFLVAFAGLLLLATPVTASESIWVAVHGPGDWRPNPGYILEIGSTAWTVNAVRGGGVTAVDLKEATIVRLRRLPDCMVVVRFVAQPDGRYVIRFSASGSPQLEDWTGQGLDAGPALDPSPMACPALPDTATVALEPSRRTPLAWIMALIAAGIFAVCWISQRTAYRDP